MYNIVAVLISYRPALLYFMVNEKKWETDDFLSLLYRVLQHYKTCWRRFPKALFIINTRWVNGSIHMHTVTQLLSHTSVFFYLKHTLTINQSKYSERVVFSFKSEENEHELASLWSLMNSLTIFLLLRLLFHQTLTPVDHLQMSLETNRSETTYFFSSVYKHHC